MASQYQRGATFERRVLDDFTKAGYVATRSAGSHGLMDIIAVSPEHVVFVQAKIDGRLDPAEWNELYACALSVGALPVLAERVRGGVRYWLLTGPKDKRGARQPRRPWAVPR